MIFSAMTSEGQQEANSMDTSSTGAPAPTASANDSARPEWAVKMKAEADSIMAELDRLYAAEAK